MVKTTQASNFQTQALMTTTLYFKINAILFAHKLTFTGSPSLHFKNCFQDCNPLLKLWILQDVKQFLKMYLNFPVY